MRTACFVHVCVISGNVLGMISSQWLHVTLNPDTDDRSLFASPRAFVPVKAAICRHFVNIIKCSDKIVSIK